MNKKAMLAALIENLDMGIAARVAQRLVLQEIFLVDAKISRDPLIESPEALSLEHKCSTEILESDKDKNLFIILCKFRVAAFNGEAPDKLVMKIEASFCTSYFHNFLPDEPHIEDIEVQELVEMVDYGFTLNPITNTWPYWREFVQSMSNRMGFPALTVPLLEIAMKKPAAKEVKNQPVKKKSNRRNKVNT
jgi:hypothetical protein